MNTSEFQETVWDYYSKNARTMPWRDNTDPYYVLVSELMLQQTQVDRVIPKFKEFVSRFPDITSLAGASLGDVISLWSGLGYNRRARFLHESAKAIVAEMGGTIPNDNEKLISLPGIGENTAAAIRAYAFNEPVVFVETNIRAAIIHHFFEDTSEGVSDAEVLEIAQNVLDTENPREWYWALMDYGSHLKKTHGNPARRSKHHTKQSAFEGSSRQIRGNVLKLLITEPMSFKELQAHINDDRLQTVLDQLVKEKMIIVSGHEFSLAS